MVTLEKHKRGDTFYFDVVWEGATVSELKAQVRDPAGVLVTDLVVTATGEPSTFRFTASNTTNWAVGILETDVQRTANGVIKSSDIIRIPVVKDVTL